MTPDGGLSRRVTLRVDGSSIVDASDGGELAGPPLTERSRVSLGRLDDFLVLRFTDAMEPSKFERTTEHQVLCVLSPAGLEPVLDVVVRDYGAQNYANAMVGPGGLPEDCSPPLSASEVVSRIEPRRDGLRITTASSEITCGAVRSKRTQVVTARWSAGRFIPAHVGGYDLTGRYGTLSLVEGGGAMFVSVDGRFELDPPLVSGLDGITHGSKSYAGPTELPECTVTADRATFEGRTAYVVKGDHVRAMPWTEGKVAARFDGKQPTAGLLQADQVHCPAR